MYNFLAHSTNPELGQVSPLSINREWMDNTWDAHAYHCFPVTLGNGLGWGISFPEDISFIWDGISDSTPDHVKILKGEKYAYSGRANATVSFNTGVTFKTEENLSLLSMPAPNYFVPGAQAFTTLISSSFFKGDLPCAWMVTQPNVEITIKAGTPVIAIIPIDLSMLQNSEIQFEDLSKFQPSTYDASEYSQIVYNINRQGKWTDFYRNAKDHLGNTIGEHQVKAIRLKGQSHQ
jgi:hypothetical protein